VISAEQYVANVLSKGQSYPVSVGKASVLTTVPYISVWHVQDIILNSTTTGQTIYQSSLVRIEYESNTGQQALTVANVIRPLLVAPILILQEGESIANPITGVTGTTAPPPGGSLKWFLVCVNLAKIQS